MEDEKKPAPADNKGDKHTDQPAKFNRENYGNLREQMGKEAYEKAKEDTGNEDIAKSAQRKAEAYQAEKEGSHGKFSPEYQRLNHADAEGNKAKNEIEKNGGDEAAQEDAYRKAFGETYKKDKLYNEDSLLARAHENGNIAEKALGEDASDADKAKAYNDAYEKTYADAAKERKNGIGEVTSDDLGGRTVDEMRPGSDYYNRYKEASEDDVKIHHGEHVDDAYVHSSLNNDASGNFSTPETFSTPREGQQKLATPNSNTMEKTERVGFNAKNNDGQNVFVIEGKAAPQLHNQNVNGSAFEKIDPNAPDLNGGGTQLVTNTNGLRDGSMRKINEVPDAVVPLDFKKDVGQGDVKPVTKESLRDAPLEPVDSVMPNVKDAKGMEKKTAQPSSMHEALNNQDLFKENPAGEYTYSEGELGKSASGVLKKTDTPVRDAKAQREAGGEYRRPDDDGGHYIGARYGGDPGEKNLDPQNRNLNRGSFKHREDGWDRSLDNGDQIYAHVEGYKSNGSDRPDAFMGYTVTEHPDGSREWDAFSYQNESAATQEAWADELAEFDAENPDDHYDNPMQEVYEREDYVNRDDQ